MRDFAPIRCGCANVGFGETARAKNGGYRRDKTVWFWDGIGSRQVAYVPFCLAT